MKIEFVVDNVIAVLGETQVVLGLRNGSRHQRGDERARITMNNNDNTTYNII